MKQNENIINLADIMQIINNYDQALTYLYEFKSSNCNDLNKIRKIEWAK